MTDRTHRVRPTPTDMYLGNPHKGCCTFQHFNGDDLFPGTGWSESGPLEFPPRKARGVIPGYLPTTVAYCRWFWRHFEPDDGVYDFSMIEKSLEVCADRGQSLAVRLQAFGSFKQPALPDWYLRDYTTSKWTIPWSGSTITIPDYDSDEYFERWAAVNAAFAERFDDHPLLESIDITYIGPWGEGAGEYTQETADRFAKMYADTYPITPKLALIGGKQLRSGVLAGSGWRADCFGDAPGMCSPPDEFTPFPLAYDHMHDVYPRQVVTSGAQDAWETAPVHMETCGVPMRWYQTQRDIDFILQQGLKYHTSYFMPKSTALPEAWMEQLKDFCRQIGYRFVYRQATLPDQVAKDGSLHVESWIENVGVAPIYRRYDFALRFRQDSKEEIVTLDDVDIRTWLPGDEWIATDIDLPKGFRQGAVEVAAGLIDAGQQAKVRFAVKEQFKDNWVDLGRIDVC